MKHIFFITTDDVCSAEVKETLTQLGITTLAGVKEYLNNNEIQFQYYSDPFEVLEHYNNNTLNAFIHDLMVLELGEVETAPDTLDNDRTRDIAIRIVDKLVTGGFVENCIDTDDETEFEIQDIVHEELNNTFNIQE